MRQQDRSYPRPPGSRSRRRGSFITVLVLLLEGRLVEGGQVEEVFEMVVREVEREDRIVERR